MYKIINPKGISLYFVGNGASVIFSGKKSLPVKIRVDSSNGDYTQEDILKIDGFNILDSQIISNRMKELINKYTLQGDIEYIKIKLILDGVILKNDYYAMNIKSTQRVSILTASETDWVPDARYVVKNSQPIHDIFIDSELKFPVLSNSIVDYFNANKLKLTFHKYEILESLE